jgi:nucleotide-binding universal stress UspA family protein
MNNVLIPIDFSSMTDLLLEQGVIYGQKFNSKVWLIHVAAPDPDFIGYESGPETERDHVAERLHQEHRQLQTLAENLRQQGINAVALLVQGPTISTILEEAKKIPADLLIIGSHGRGGLYKLLLGSVSEGIIKGAGCPILLIPPRLNPS